MMARSTISKKRDIGTRLIHMEFTVITGLEKTLKCNSRKEEAEEAEDCSAFLKEGE